MRIAHVTHSLIISLNRIELGIITKFINHYQHFSQFTHKLFPNQNQIHPQKVMKTTQAYDHTTRILHFVSYSTIHKTKQTNTHFDDRRISGFFDLLGVLTFDNPSTLSAEAVFAAARALASRLTKLLVARIACGFKS